MARVDVPVPEMRSGQEFFEFFPDAERMSGMRAVVLPGIGILRRGDVPGLHLHGGNFSRSVHSFALPAGFHAARVHDEKSPLDWICRDVVPGAGAAFVQPVARGGLLDYAVEKDRKSTRLNSSHPSISYAVFCLKKKKKKK